MESIYSRQLLLEQEQVRQGIENYRKQIQETPLTELPPGVRLMREILSPLSNAIRIFLLPTKGAQKAQDIKKIIKDIPEHELAFLVAQNVLNNLSIGGITVQQMAINIGNAIVDHVRYANIRRDLPAFIHVVEKNLKTSNANQRKTVINHAANKINYVNVNWGKEQKLHCGVKFLDLMIESTGMIKRELSPFYKGEKKDFWRIVPTDGLMEWINKAHSQCELLQPVELPMLIRPVEWTSLNSGGYITLRNNLVKTRSKAHSDKLREQDILGNLKDVYKAVNNLQNTPWVINQDILDVLKTLWDTGGTLGDIPSRDPIPLPSKPWNNDEEFKQMKTEQPEIIKEWKAKATAIYADNSQSMVSKRKSVRSKLELAEKYKNEDEFFYCYTLDWRGRAYPLQSHVTPQSDDLGKALIKFKNTKLLTEEGVYWLKVHLANCFGYDKVTFDDRIKWVEEHQDLILDSANNPLDGHRFWDEADSPFCFLAACFEYASYLKNPTSFQTAIPIALDATCSGLQHFSAMLLDSQGGSSVNLVPSSNRNDVYQEVAKVLIKLVEQDLSDPDETISNMAALWNGKIDRKIVKRAVMTTPYSASMTGFIDQLMAELKKRPEGFLETDRPRKACVYLAKRLKNAIGMVLVASKDAMKYLQDIAKFCNHNQIELTWRTPVGFFCLQQYHKRIEKTMDTFWGKVRIRLQLKQDIDKLNTTKQVSGVSPNFVHSMDASHMMRTTNKCFDAGITDFAMIHDSFGTHASNVPLLNKLLREAFVEQYSVDQLNLLREEVISKLTDPTLIADVPQVPNKGTMNIEAIKESLYFFA